MAAATMRSARLHGLEDLRIDEVEVPRPGPGELLVEVEGNGVCATDARKYRVGVNDGQYPFNPGHEWVGRVVAAGEGAGGWAPGDRVYGDTYGGYADYALVSVEPRPWSCGPVHLDDDVPLERAIFLEPLADCLHALVDQAGLETGTRLVIVAAGSMGLLMTGLAADLGADVTVVEPLPERRRLATGMGAAATLAPDGWPDAIASGGGADAVVLCAGDPDLVDGCVTACRDGGTVVLFAGFGDRPRASIDLNALHYREVSLVGSEWVGTPGRTRCEWYDRAAAVVAAGPLSLESLVTHRCSFDDLEDALVRRGSFDVLKTVFTPGGGR